MLKKEGMHGKEKERSLKKKEVRRRMFNIRGGGSWISKKGT